MKKFLTGCLCVGLALSLCACGSSKSDSESETEDDNVYAYTLDIDKFVELGQYKNLTYTPVDTTVTDDEVEEQINTNLQANATYDQITDRAVQDGDTVNIDYTGKIDGEEFAGGSGSDYNLQIGSDTFIDGFEDGLIGKNPGETVTLNLTFPDDYSSEDLAGKDATFDVTINYIQGDQHIPELTDDFVASQSIDGVSTVDDYRSYIRQQLESQKESDAQSQELEELFEQAVSNSKIKKYPQVLLDQYEENYRSYYEQYASAYGLSFKDFLSQYMDETEDDFDKAAAEYAKQATANVLVVCAIAEEEGYEVTDEVYNEKAQEYAEQNGYDSVEALEKDYSKGYLTQTMINDYSVSVIQEGATASTAETETETETETESQ
ncbi:MAG: trigger factor [Lachnospiraceae bacterium]|jgi:trigger factor